MSDNSVLYIGVRSQAPRGLRVIRHASGLPEGHREWPLPWRLDLANHSPTGFECGYHGSGPAQLALAMLADALQDDQLAVRLHQQWKAERISKLPRDEGWQISRDEVVQWAWLRSGRRPAEDEG